LQALQISVLDAAIVIAYFAGIVALGVWISRRRIRGREDFFLAGREMTWPLIGASMFSTNISSQQFVGQAGAAFTMGITAGAFQLVGAMCFVFLAVFFVQVYMGLRLYTSPEFFERRYSAGCRAFVSAVNILSIVSANIAAALYAGAVVLMTLLGWKSDASLWMAVIVLGVTTGLYTLLGGLRSVIYTDFIQNFLLILGGAVTLVVGVVEAGGIGEVLSLRDATGWSMWSVIRPASHTFGWLPMVTGVLILGVHGHCTDQDYIQRALAAKNVFHAKMGAVFAAFLKVLALFVIAAPGVVAAKLYPNLDSGDRAYVHLLINVMPVGLTGICLAGLLAAIMSSVDSGLCAASSLLTFDFIAKFAPRLSERMMLVLGRVLIVILLVLCVVWAPFIKNFKGLYLYLVQIWSLTAPPVFVCVVFGLFWRRANAAGAISTLLVGCVSGAFAFAVINVKALAGIKNSLPVYLTNPLNAGFVITLLCAAVMVVVSCARGESTDNEARMEAIRLSRAGEAMQPDEARRYRMALMVLLMLWVGVVIAFSPLALGK